MFDWIVSNNGEVVASFKSREDAKAFGAANLEKYPNARISSITALLEKP